MAVMAWADKGFVAVGGVWFEGMWGNGESGN
ncbi:Uncharacterised protein [Nocardia brasiliensis]|nr:Uncharacterised protein [Nocardia brasiliensis]